MPAAMLQAAAAPLTSYERRTVDDVVSILMAAERFAFDLGEPPAEESALPEPVPPPESASRREVRSIAASARPRLGLTTSFVCGSTACTRCWRGSARVLASRARGDRHRAAQRSLGLRQRLSSHRCARWTRHRRARETLRPRAKRHRRRLAWAVRR
jgi:hypothetical protein